jgi:transcriptional regulator with XRE-family HTH domain
MTHQEILRKLLFDKKTSKRALARMIDVQDNNSSNYFNKHTYSEEMIKKISEALGVEASVFTIHATINHSGDGDAIQHIATSDRIAELESRLRDKEEIIEVLREKLRKYEYMDKRN